MSSPNPDIEQFAEALLCLARASGASDRLEQEVPLLAEIVRRDEKLRNFLADSAVSEAGKCRALEDLLAGQVRPLLIRYMQILVEQRAMPLWPDVAERFLQLVAEAGQMSSGEIVAAAPLDGGKVKEIESEVGRILGKIVRLRVRVDGALLGGMMVRVGDFAIDGSLDSRLDAIHRDLLKVR